MGPTVCTDCCPHVNRALEVLRALPHGAENGRPLNIGEADDNPAAGSESSDHYLRLLLEDVAGVVGGDFLSKTDPVLLEQFCIMTVHRGEPGGEVLQALITTFLKAYADPEQSDSAVGQLQQRMTPNKSGVRCISLPAALISI